VRLVGRQWYIYSLAQLAIVNAKKVFDGHGGPEVARFCQLYLVSALTQQPTWQDASSTQTNATTEDDDNETKDPAASDIGQALISAFHALDRMIDHPKRRYVPASASLISLYCFLFLTHLLVHLFCAGTHTHPQ
jgi:serine/threonine protein phosphatase PrpC